MHYTLITGATSGIGKACAEALAVTGRNIILVARREQRLTDFKKELKEKYKVDVLAYQLDLQKLEDIEKFFITIADKSIDVLINNAGLARGKAHFEEYDWDDIQEMIATNIIGFTKVAQKTIPFLKKTKGHIVNISSIAGLESYEGGAVYCGTKAFVQKISAGLRHDLLGTEIRVTDIAPGAVKTEFSVVRFHGDEAQAEKVYEGFVPLSAKDIADCVVFALHRPAHVNISSMVIMPTSQASATRIFKKQ